MCIQIAVKELSARKIIGILWMEYHKNVYFLKENLTNLI